MIVLAALATLAAAQSGQDHVCSIDRDGRLRKGRCVHSVDADGGGANPVDGRRSILPGVDAITLEPIDPGHAQMRLLTPEGINSASAELLMEDNGRCWQGTGERVCFGARVAESSAVLSGIPEIMQGEWDQDPDGRCGSPGVDLKLSARTILADGEEWRVTRVVERAGVLRVEARRTAGVQTHTWLIARGTEDGLLVVGLPNELARCPRGG